MLLDVTKAKYNYSLLINFVLMNIANTATKNNHNPFCLQHFPLLSRTLKLHVTVYNIVVPFELAKRKI